MKSVVCVVLQSSTMLKLVLIACLVLLASGEASLHNTPSQIEYEFDF
jgi:hypothetical protein